MTHTDYTKKILNIKDENIYFYDDCLEIKEIKGIKTKIFHGYLTYTPEYCPHCGCVNKGFDDVIKWNFKRNCKIKVTKVANYNTILLLDKQRFFCKNCNRTFIATTNVVDFHKQISNDTIVKNNGLLPEIFGIDEFSATKDTISKLAFIIVNQTNKNIFDINNSRKSLDIDKYFRNYPKKERDNVKFITLDLYKPYYKLMHSLFRNAILIPDRFHIVIQVRNALDKTRIKLCIKSNPNYTKLKKYWKLILKDKRELDKNNKKYQKCFNKKMSQYDIVSYLLNTNEELYETYQIYQSILYSIDTKNKDIFLSIINGKNFKISKYMKKALKTLKNMKEYILNAFDYEYSNGIVEGTNNLIKQIKHTACGYRKFKHLKARVMLIKGLYNPIKA